MRLLVISNMKPTAQLPAFGVFVANQVEALAASGAFSVLLYLGVTTNAKGKVALVSKYFKLMVDLFHQAIFSRERFDFIHVHYYFPTIGYALIYKLLRNWRVKIVVTFHGSDVQLYQRPSWFYRFASRFIDHHIFVSHGLASGYFKTVSAAQQSILSAGILDLYQPPDAKVTKKFDLLIVGAVTKSKGLDRLLALLDSIEQPLRVGVVGEGELLMQVEAYQSEVHQLSALGRCDPPSIKAYLQQSRFLISLSVHESFGLVITESMACGTPVIATQTYGAQAQIKHDENGFLLHNIDDILEFCQVNRTAIMAYLEDTSEQKYASLCTNAVDSAQKYRMNQVIGSLLLVYRLL